MFTLWTLFEHAYCVLSYILWLKKKHIQNYSYLSFLSSLVWWHAPQFFLRLLQPCLVSIVFELQIFKTISILFFSWEKRDPSPKKLVNSRRHQTGLIVLFDLRQVRQDFECNTYPVDFLVNLRHNLYFSRSDENIFYCLFFTSLVRFSSSN